MTPRPIRARRRDIAPCRPRRGRNDTPRARRARPRQTAESTRRARRARDARARRSRQRRESRPNTSSGAAPTRGTKAGRPRAQPRVERFRDARHMSALRPAPARSRDVRRARRIRQARSENGLAIQVDALSAESHEHLADALHPMPSLLAQKRLRDAADSRSKK